MNTDQGTWLTHVIEHFVQESPENSLKLETGEKAWDEVLVGYSSGADPLYDTYKDVVGDFHWKPEEIFALTFPDVPFDAKDLTVISWILPQREATKKDHRKEKMYPCHRWVQARFPGEEFNNCLRRHVVEQLAKEGVQAVAPMLSPAWKWIETPKYVFASTWSERHAAYAAGLGTFGLSDGLITPRGKAHRVGSVVAKVGIPASQRPYEDHHAYCLFYFDGSCTGCRKRCPVDAITEEGHDKKKCWAHAGGTCAEYVKEHFGFEGYGCGLCQVAVPCESGIPAKILKSLG